MLIVVDQESQFESETLVVEQGMVVKSTAQALFLISVQPKLSGWARVLASPEHHILYN